MIPTLRKIFRYFYYVIYGKTGEKIKLNNEEYTVSAYVSRGIGKDVINETPLKLLINLSKNADLVFDIGANIGIIATILAKKMKPGTIIYSFEPAPVSFKYLTDAARVQDGNAKIIPVNYAISNNNGKLEFTNDGNSCTNHISTQKETGTITTDAVTIDWFCQTNNIIPQVLKIDIEGAEFWALEGMQKTLKNNNCLVLLEMHGDFLNDNHIDGSMFGKLINSFEYKVYNIKGDEINSDQVMNNACVILSKERPPEHIFQIS